MHAPHHWSRPSASSSQTVHFWCPAESCPTAKREDVWTAVHAAVRADWAAEILTITWSMEEQESKRASLQITSCHTKSGGSARTFLLWLSQRSLTRAAPHTLLGKPLLDGSRSNRGHPLVQLSPTNSTFLTFLSIQSEYTNRLPASNLNGSKCQELSVYEHHLRAFPTDKKTQSCSSK